MGMNSQMDPKTKQLIESAEALSGPEMTPDAENNGTERMIRALCSAVREQDKRARHAEEERDLFSKRIDELEAKLAEAIDIAGETIPYVSDYFRMKYEMDARLAELLPNDTRSNAE